VAYPLEGNGHASDDINGGATSGVVAPITAHPRAPSVSLALSLPLESMNGFIDGVASGRDNAEGSSNGLDNYSHNSASHVHLHHAKPPHWGRQPYPTGPPSATLQKPNGPLIGQSASSLLPTVPVLGKSSTHHVGGTRTDIWSPAMTRQGQHS
jgi:hypothetical protein